MPNDANPSSPAASDSYDSATAPGQYEQERRRKRDELRQLGHNPYGRHVESVRSLKDVRDLHITDFGQDGGPVVTTSGRIVLKRDMGKLSFLTLRDDTGELQIALQKNRLPEADWAVRNHLDLGDLVVVSGPLGKTNKGEITVWASELQMAAKSLVVPPEKHRGLEDVELRYRQRYVDLWANPEVMETMKLRMRIIESMREYLRGRGYLEVETPMLQTIHGGAAARPFTTHHNALDIDLYLRIAPELYLKRLLVGGLRKVFEINRNFRNEGISPRHNPEFTMLEAYEAFGNYETMMEMVEDLVCTIAMEVFGTLEIVHHRGTEAQKTINLQRPWRRVKMVEIVEQFTGWRYEKGFIDSESRAELVHRRVNRKAQASARSLSDFPEWQQYLSAATSVESWTEGYRRVKEVLMEDQGRHWERWQALRDSLANTDGPDRDPTPEESAQMQALADRAERIGRAVNDLEQWNMFFSDVTDPMFWKIDEQPTAEEQLQYVFETEVEPHLIDPCFVTHVPSVIIPLARPSEEDPYFAEVYELAINGQEISPGYTELNDPDVQEQLFRQQVGEEAERQQIDQDFLNALKVGMPPAGGMGLGVDRLVMMLTGAESIRDVLLFPLMRPQAEKKEAGS